MHVFHLHGFERHDRLAGRDALARFDQTRNDTTVHRRANLAVAAGGGSRRSRRSQRKVADRKRDALVQDIEPVAVAEEPCRFHHAVDAETNGIATEFVDLKLPFAAVYICDIPTIALA